MIAVVSYLYRWLRGAVVLALLSSASSALGAAGETTLLVMGRAFLWSFGLTALLLGSCGLAAGGALLVAVRVGGRLAAIGLVAGLALVCVLASASALNVVSRLDSPYFRQAVAVLVALAGFVITILALFAAAFPFLEIGRRARIIFVSLTLAVGVALEYADRAVYPGLYPPVHALLHWTAVLAWMVSLLLLPWGTPRKILGSLCSLVALVAAIGGFALTQFDTDRPEGVLITRSHLGNAVVRAWRPMLNSASAEPCAGEVRPLMLRRRRLEANDAPPRRGPDAHPRTGSGERPSFLVITVDSLAYGYFGHNGRAGARTPNIDGLAARGAVFARAYTAGGITMLSIPALFRGVSPRRMHWEPLYELPTFEFLTRSDVQERWGSGAKPRFINVASSSLGEVRPTLPAILRSSGYEAIAVVNDNFTDFRAYFGEGFGFGELVVADRLKFPTDAAEQARLDDVVVDDAVLRLSQQHRPFFFWVHIFPTHEPMHVHREVSPPTDGGVLSMYQHEVNYVDYLVGRLLDALPTDRSVFVLLTADHGEQLLPQKAHGFDMQEEMIRVPLIIVGPAIPVRTVDSVVSLMDVYPTILSLSGVECGPCMDNIDGVDLRIAWSGSPDARRRVVVVESWLHDGAAKPRWDMVAAVSAERKLKYDRLTGRYSVTNPVVDPRDTTDLQLLEGRGELGTLLRARQESDVCLRF
jgi:arylsulfatase A-like enzyme